MKNTLIIVDPLRYTGAGYLNVIKKNVPNNYIIGLWNSKIYHDFPGHKFSHLIDKHILYDVDCNNDFDYLLSIIKEYNVKGFLVGGDSGFILADRLQSHFFPNNSNDPEKQQFRTSKLEIFKHLKSKNLVDSDQFLLDEYTLQRCNNTNVVAKPINGLGNIDVFIKPDFETIKNLLNHEKKFMIQNFIDGPEYCIEISSNNGQHKCTMASLYKGDYLVDDVFPWREENELIDSRNPVVQLLYDYIVPILDELGIKIGLTWSQIKIDKNNNPRLIEINFRSQGRALIKAIRTATNTDWASESIRSYFNMPIDTERFYTKIGDFNKICVNNYRERFIEELDLTYVKSLSSTLHCEVYNKLFPKTVPVTKNFDTVMSMIIIANKDSSKYLSDMHNINSWKKLICG